MAITIFCLRFFGTNKSLGFKNVAVECVRCGMQIFWAQGMMCHNNPKNLCGEKILVPKIFKMFIFANLSQAQTLAGLSLAIE